MKKTILALLFIVVSLISFNINAQQLSGAPPVIVNPLVQDPDGNDVPFAYTGSGQQIFTLQCGVNDVDLIARYNDVGTTDSYTVESISFAAARFESPAAGDPGEDIDLDQDDKFSTIYSVTSGGEDFDICFYNNVFNQFIINDNGVVTFDLTNADSAVGGNPANGGWRLFYNPAEAAAIPGAVAGGPIKLGTTGNQFLLPNSIYLPGHDLYTTASATDPSQLFYWNILGDAPNRRLVIGLSNIPMYACNSQKATTQIIIYETTNIIEVHLLNKETCNGWNPSSGDGYTLLGIQNSTKDVSTVAPGRDTGVWDATFESWRFVPNGGAVRPDFAWYENYDHTTNTGTLITTDPQHTFNPTVDNTVYTAVTTYIEACSGETIIEAQDIVITLNNALTGEIVDDVPPAGNSIETVNLCIGETFTVYADAATTEANTTIEYSWTQVSSGTEVSTTDSLLIDSAAIGATETFEVLISLYDASNVLLCSFTDTVAVVVSDPSFEYTDINYCATTDVDPSPINVTPAGGIFTIDNGGVFVDTATDTSTIGQIDLTASGAGTDGTGNFTVTYTTGTAPNTCDDTFDVIISTGNAAFTYESLYCTTAGINPIASDYVPGGIFTIFPAATFVDNTTGEILLTSLTVGVTYTVTYTIGGVCGGSSTQTFDVSAVADPTFTYPTVCLSDVTTLLPDTIASTGGSFVISAGGTIDASTGNLTGTPAGTYDITYTTVGCVDTLTLSVVVNAIKISAFTIPATRCAGDGNVIPVLDANIDAGNFTIDAGTINAATGEITVDPAITVPVTYQVTYLTTGPCPDSTSVSITINPEDVALFAVASATVCVNDATYTPTLDVTSTLGGTYTINGTGVIDANTGIVNLTTSTDGVYTITYDTASIGNACPNSDTFTLTIEENKNTAFTYPTEFCKLSPTNPIATTYVSGGVFTVLPAVTINPSTGELDLTTTTEGVTYVVTYEFSVGTCTTGPTSHNILITADDNSTVTYPDLIYCNDNVDPIPTIVTAGGTFTIDNGGVINPTTGIIDLSTSGFGTFTITYDTTSAGTSCATSDDFIITIEETKDAAFTYPTSFCQADTTNPTATPTNTGGTFTVTPAASINAGTGELDLSTTTAGITYTISYAFIGGNCPSGPETQTISITASDVSDFVYTPNTYCYDGAEPTPTLDVSATLGGAFTINNGGTIDVNTGVVDLDMTVAGEYIIRYTTPTGACQTFVDFTITILDSKFDYPTNVCQADAHPIATNFIAGGTFSVDNGATIDATSGELDLDTTTEGTTYTITYSFNAFVPSCPKTQQILIEPSPTVGMYTSELRICTNGDGTANFDILSIEDEIRTNAADVITYHYTISDAETGANPINVTPFAVTAGVVWASVLNTAGCIVVVEVPLVVELCYLIIPQWFNPNSANVNHQTFNIEEIRSKFPKYEIYIYNRYGNEVFAGDASKPDWNGNVNNDDGELPTGTYFYIIKLNDHQDIKHKGWVYLQR